MPPSAWRTGTAFTASPSGASRRRPPTSSAAAASPPAAATGSRWPTGPIAWWRPASGPWPPAGPTTTIAMWGWRSACCTSPSAGRAATSAPSSWRSSSPPPGRSPCGRPPPSTCPTTSPRSWTGPARWCPARCPYSPSGRGTRRCSTGPQAGRGSPCMAPKTRLFRPGYCLSRVLMSSLTSWRLV